MVSQMESKPQARPRTEISLLDNLIGSGDQGAVIRSRKLDREYQPRGYEKAASSKDFAIHEVDSSANTAMVLRESRPTPECFSFRNRASVEFAPIAKDWSVIVRQRRAQFPLGGSRLVAMQQEPVVKV